MEKGLIHTGCSVGSCLNGGTCVEHTGTCQCPAGYHGPQCQVRVTSHGYDVTDPCASYRCLHGAQCLVETSNDRPTATCMCPDNWTGKHCQVCHYMHMHVCTLYWFKIVTANSPAADYTKYKICYDEVDKLISVLCKVQAEHSFSF